MKTPQKVKEKDVRIRFESAEQVELIKAAAARRGLGFNAFVRLICAGAAKHVMRDPPEDVLGRYVEPENYVDAPAA